VANGCRVMVVTAPGVLPGTCCTFSVTF